MKLTPLTHADYARLGGMEGAEVIMWLVMRGALSAQIKKIHQSYYLPSMTGLATAIYENETLALPDELEAKINAAIWTGWAGNWSASKSWKAPIRSPLARSVKGYRLNKFLHDLIIPAQRQPVPRDAEVAFEESALTQEERDIVRRRDWRAMIHYGVIFFMLEKLGAVIGVSNLHIYAAMRGQTLEEFQKTRNAPGALYSVAGSDEGKVDWDRKSPAPVLA